MAEFKVATAYADFRVDVDAGLDAAIARIRSRQSELDTKAKVVLDADTELAKAKIKELSDQKNKTSVKADADTTLAKAKIKELEKDSTVRIRAEVDKGSAKKTEDDVVSSVKKAADRANAQFSALTFAGLSLGLPAAAAAGVLGVGIALAAAPAMFAGIGIAAQRQEPAVRASLNAIGTNVNEFVSDSSTVLRGPLLQALDQVQTSFNRSKTIISNTMADSAASIKPLVGGVTDLFENVLPGLNTAVRGSMPVLQGWRSLLGQTGTGLSEFFANATTGADSAGRGLTILGGILRDALSFTGSLFANLSNASAGPLTQLQAMLRDVEASLISMTAAGSGVLGFLGGFTSSASGMLGIVRLIVAGISLLPPQLTQFAGALTATSLVARSFGLDIGAGFKGLGDKIKGAGNELSGIERGAAKAGTAVGGLAAGALNPATLAVAGLSIGLMALGAEQQAAAADAAAHASRERDLAAALRESHGAISENVRVTAAKQLADYQVSDGTRNLIADTQNLAGASGVKLLTAGYLGNVDASKQLVAQLRQTATEHTHAQSVVASLATQFDHFGTTLDGNTGALDDTGFAAKQLADIVDASGGDFQKAMQQAQSMGIAVQGNVAPTGALAAAMIELADSTAPVADRVTALKVALDSLAGRAPVFEDAIKAGNDQLRTMADGLKNGATKADGFGKSLLNVDGTISTVSKNGSSLQGLAEGLQGSFANAASGIDQMVRSGVPLADATKRVNDELGTQRDRFIEVAQKMGLTKAQAQEVADKYGLIPKEISTDITANIKKAQGAIDALPVYAAGAKGSVVISANTVPGTNKIDATVQYADGSLGIITLDGNKDPVTGKIMTSVQYADGSKGTITVDAAIAAAKAGTLTAVRYADGSTGFIKVSADTASANAAINAVLTTRYLTIRTVVVDPTGALHASTAKFNARGGLALPGYAEGGAPMVDIRPGGQVIGPGTPTSDSLVAMGNISTKEFVTNAHETAKNISELWAINRGERNYEKYPDTGRPMSGGSATAVMSAPTTNVNITIVAPPEMDYEVLAAKVSRAIALRGK